MKLFNADNTDNYTPEQMDALNAEWEIISADLEPGSDEYYQVEQRFSDEVARR